MTKYSIMMKRDIVENENYSIEAEAKELVISKTLAQRWLKMYEHHGYEGLAICPSLYGRHYFYFPAYNNLIVLNRNF